MVGGLYPLIPTTARLSLHVPRAEVANPEKVSKSSLQGLQLDTSSKKICGTLVGRCCRWPCSLWTCKYLQWLEDIQLGNWSSGKNRWNILNFTFFKNVTTKFFSTACHSLLVVVNPTHLRTKTAFYLNICEVMSHNSRAVRDCNDTANLAYLYVFFNVDKTIIC